MSSMKEVGSKMQFEWMNIILTFSMFGLIGLAILKATLFLYQQRRIAVVEKFP